MQSNDAVLCRAVLSCAVLRCAMLCHAVPCCAVLCCIPVYINPALPFSLWLHLQRLRICTLPGMNVPCQQEPQLLSRSAMLAGALHAAAALVKCLECCLLKAAVRFSSLLQLTPAVPYIHGGYKSTHLLPSADGASQHAIVLCNRTVMFNMCVRVQHQPTTSCGNTRGIDGTNMTHRQKHKFRHRQKHRSRHRHMHGRT